MRDPFRSLPLAGSCWQLWSSPPGRTGGGISSFRRLGRGRRGAWPGARPQANLDRSPTVSHRPRVGLPQGGHVRRGPGGRPPSGGGDDRGGDAASVLYERGLGVADAITERGCREFCLCDRGRICLASRERTRVAARQARPGRVVGRNAPLRSRHRAWTDRAGRGTHAGSCTCVTD